MQKMLSQKRRTKIQKNATKDSRLRSGIHHWDILWVLCHPLDNPCGDEIISMKGEFIGYIKIFSQILNRIAIENTSYNLIIGHQKFCSKCISLLLFSNYRGGGLILYDLHSEIWTYHVNATSNAQSHEQWKKISGLQANCRL